MRDPQRIPRILSKLQNYWLLNPDQRLGQLLTNIARLDGETYLWNYEDDTLEQQLDIIYGMVEQRLENVREQI